MFQETDVKKMVRPVRIASICLAPDPSLAPEEVLEKTIHPEEVLAEARKAIQSGVDLIVTPEIWSGETAEPSGDALDAYSSPVLDQCREIARTGNCYFVVCMGRYLRDEEVRNIRKRDSGGIFRKVQRFKANSSILLDRQGKIVYIYDKMYPYPPEMNLGDGVGMNVSEMTTCEMQEEAVVPGGNIGVVDCDFGRLGLAICFDMNFPGLWEGMAKAGAELVVWSAAFSGGRNASLRAGGYHYYIVTCTCVGKGDCRVIDINGDEQVVQYPREGAVASMTMTMLDLDRTIFHKNFNEGKIAEAQERYPGKLTADYSLYGEEEWIILQSADGQTSVKEICQEFGLVPLQEFKMHTMSGYIEGLRSIAWDGCREPF